MMLFLRTIVCVLSFLMMFGCAPTYETYYEYKDIKSGEFANCVSYCKVAKDTCLQKCHRQQSMCGTHAKSDLIDGLSKPHADSTLNLYVQQCQESACDCDSDYRACYEMCGGKVIKKERCISNCPDS